MRCDVSMALNLLMPRHRGKTTKWNHLGWCATFNARMLPERQDKVVRKLMRDYDKACQKPVVETIEVVDNDVWFIQRSLRYITMDWMLKRNFSWQRWAPGRLPIYLKWHGRLICWNGTHRTILAMLGCKRLRARVLDMDAFEVWRKAHPDKSMWGVRRVVVFGPAKGKKRGRK